jgi:hypothetical protein
MAEETKPMPVRTVRVDLQDAYSGFWADVQTNCSYATKLEFQSGDLARTWEAFAGLIMAWNITDTAGKVLPLPTDWARLQVEVPDEVLGELFAGYNAALIAAAQLPKV